MKQSLSIVLILISIYGVFAQQPQLPKQLDSVFITSKSKVASKNSGKIISVIDSETLRKHEGRSLAEMINEVAGIEINGSGSNDGQNLAYFVRGGRNRQVVIMVDGVQMNDASQIANDYDLRLIPTSEIASVEIQKGASSVLYGSGAATAVISIKTKQASERPIAATFTSTLGTNRAAGDQDNALESFNNYVAVNGTLGPFFYDINFSNRYVDGLSAIAAPEGAENFEADVFNRYNTRVNLGVHISERIKVSQFFSLDNFRADFDDFNYTDAENRSISRQLKTGGHFSWKYDKGTYIFNDAYSWIEREIESSFPAKYNSRSYTFDTYADHRVTEKLRILLGLNGNFSRFDSETVPFSASEFETQVDSELANFTILDPYLNAVYISGFGVNLNAGIRLNNHSEYGTHFVYNFNPSYGFDTGENHLKFLGSYSTAYITPSLFQLFDPSYGNPNLQPEENTTLEGGISFDLNDTFNFSAVYFRRKEDNFVDFVTVDPKQFIFQYQNISESFNTSGIEVTAEARITGDLKFFGNYTNTQADKRFALRIPEHKANAQLAYTVWKSTNFSLKYLIVGERTDSFFNPATFESEEILLDSYGLLGLNVRTELNDTLALFASVDNIFDTEYEELYRYQTKGRNVLVGFSLSF